MGYTIKIVRELNIPVAFLSRRVLCHRDALLGVYKGVCLCDTHPRTYTRKCVCMQTRESALGEKVFMYTRAYTDTHAHTIYIYVHICVYIYLYIYIYI